VLGIDVVEFAPRQPDEFRQTRQHGELEAPVRCAEQHGVADIRQQLGRTVQDAARDDVVVAVFVEMKPCCSCLFVRREGGLQALKGGFGLIQGGAPEVYFARLEGESSRRREPMLVWVEHGSVVLVSALFIAIVY